MARTGHFLVSPTQDISTVCRCSVEDVEIRKRPLGLLSTSWMLRFSSHCRHWSMEVDRRVAAASYKSHRGTDKLLQPWRQIIRDVINLSAYWRHNSFVYSFILWRSYYHVYPMSIVRILTHSDCPFRKARIRKRRVASVILVWRHGVTEYTCTSAMLTASFVVVSLTGCARVGGPKNVEGRWGPAPLGWGVIDPTETRYSATCVSTPNFVALGQTVWL